jgi:hypothetical protein
MTNRSVSLNSTIKLKVVFNNFKSEPVNPSEITLVITKPNSDQIVINDGFLNLETGFFVYEFNQTDIAGNYTEEWIALIDGEEILYDFHFTVYAGGEIKAGQNIIDYNELILITLDSTISDFEGNQLNEDYEFYYCTEFNPFYAPIEMLRVECGTWMNDIPDDTLGLAIHWSSIKADQFTCKKPVGQNYFYARTRFVLFDAAISLFTMPVGAYGSNSKTHKTLGDLSVQNADLDLDIKDLLKEYKEQRDEWMRVINAGGHVTFGQSFGTTFGEKGIKRSDKNLISRQWHDPWNEYYWLPTNNSKYMKPGENKYKSGYTIWNYHYFTTGRLGRGQ